MIADIRTILWKETRSLLRFQGRRSQMIVSLLTPLIASIFFPIMLAMAWVETYFSLFVSVAIPLIVIGITVPDAFAGERERHTLETLLASRLPDRAILFGKMLVSVVIGWLTTLLVFFLSLVVLNLVHVRAGFVLYQPQIIAAQLVSSLAMSILVAALGVLISLRAETVQIAQQTLFTAIMVPMMLLGFIPMVFLLMADGIGEMREILARIHANQVVWTVTGCLLAVDILLLLAGQMRFKREKLL